MAMNLVMINVHLNCAHDDPGEFWLLSAIFLPFLCTCADELNKYNNVIICEWTHGDGDLCCADSEFWQYVLFSLCWWWMLMICDEVDAMVNAARRRSGAIIDFKCQSFFHVWWTQDVSSGYMLIVTNVFWSFESIRGSTSSVHIPLFPGPFMATPLFPGPFMATPLFPGPFMATPLFPGPFMATPLFPGPFMATPLFPGQFMATPLFPGPFMATPLFPGPFMTYPRSLLLWFIYMACRHLTPWSCFSSHAIKQELCKRHVITMYGHEVDDRVCWTNDLPDEREWPPLHGFGGWLLNIHNDRIIVFTFRTEMHARMYTPHVRCKMLSRRCIQMLHVAYSMVSGIRRSSRRWTDRIVAGRARVLPGRELLLLRPKTMVKPGRMLDGGTRLLLAWTSSPDSQWTQSRKER